MILKVSDPSMTASVVRRAFFLAYNACGRTSGMGFMKERSSVNEEQVWTNVVGSGDYPSGLMGSSYNEPYGDYVFGRMMKLSMKFNGNEIVVKDDAPRWDYQGWSGEKYPTYASLVEAAAKELGVTLVS